MKIKIYYVGGGGSYTGSTHALGACRQSSILCTPIGPIVKWHHASFALTSRRSDSA